MPGQQHITNSEWVKSVSHSLVNERDIAIFQMGKEKGAKEESDRIQKIIENNLSKTYNDTTKVIEKFRAEKIDIISARLKVKSIYSFKIILAIKFSESVAEKMDNIYDFIFNLEKSINKENYFVDFSIIKANENFSDSKVENDGYIYKHRLIINEKSSRPAQS
jgi:hypothetical protein